MTRRWAAAGLVILICGMGMIASAKKKKDAPASKLFCHAQYAYVATTEGDVLNPNVLPEDRDAANQLLENIQGWKRYNVVYRPSEADLVFVVRTGRLASAQLNGGVAAGGPYPSGGVTVGRNPGAGTQNPMQNPPGTQDPGTAGEYPQGRGIGAGAGAEAGPPNDLLRIYTSGGTDDIHTMLWEQTEHDGLQGSQPLFQRLRDAVEATCEDSGNSKGRH